MLKVVLRSSRIPGFYKLPVKERINILKELVPLSDEEVNLLTNSGSLELKVADRMIENVIGVMPVPLGVALNFLINGKEYIVPMAIEESSVVAAASNAAKMARESGGFHAEAFESIMIGQIQVTAVSDIKKAEKEILRHRETLIELANECDPLLVRLGGGMKDVRVRKVSTFLGPMVLTEILVDVKDAMGANVVNTMAEKIAPFIEKITNGKVYLRILSNLADKRLARAKAVFLSDVIGGREVVDGIIKAYALADADPYRAATHNKGIMNGVTAVVLATGNDTRAVEAGAHAYASRTGRYRSLTVWRKNKDGDLVGEIELPVAVGVVGGISSIHPLARINRKILGVKSARELAEVIASVGLAQNFAALRALATEGIQKGHMKLHARNIAMAAGAQGNTVDLVVKEMIRRGKIRMDEARKILEEIEPS